MCDNNCSTTIPKGEKGDTGLTGPIGPSGATGSTGATGSAGATGATGAAGANAYVYICWADADTGAGFTTTFSPTKDYIGVVSSNTVLTPTVSDFSGKWKLYKGQQGGPGATGDTGPQGDQGIQGVQGDPGNDGADGAGIDTTFGITDPSGTPATNPAIYFNTNTYDIWKYAGSWTKIIQGFQGWQTIGTYNTGDGWQDSGDADFILKYRKEGKNVRIIGNPSNATPTGLAVSQTIFTLPAGYRPAFQVYETGLDLTLAATPIIEVRPDGGVRARGDLATFTIDSCYFNFTFPIA